MSQSRTWVRVFHWWVAMPPREAYALAKAKPFTVPADEIVIITVAWAC